jgi:tetratricopeptide (TPR) repeat protein
MKTGVEVLEAPRNAGRVLCDEARRLFELGAEKVAANDHAEALPALRRARELAPDHAHVRSLLGVAIARVERDFEQSRALCESAAKQEFFNPDLYFNLSRVYLEFGRRAEALRYLRRGQMIDPGHVSICQSIGELGQRQTPIIPFLPRRHPINRALGSARNFVLSGLDPRSQYWT